VNFEEVFLPHLDAAYNLARWLTRDASDADDVVQEAYLRAFRFFDGFQGGDSRSWILRIVRNTCYTWLSKNRMSELSTEFDEELHNTDGNDPEAALIEDIDRRVLRGLIESLPAEFREVIVLRDVEGLSYKEIAGIADIQLGTVMSRLARARQKLQAGYAALAGGGQQR
jgi:RNA polymerase sigma-70 factor (ECF subfamily)